MQEPNNQNGKDAAREKEEGRNNSTIEGEGYYSMFHAVEEFLYGPKSPTSPKDKVLRFLLHQELRWPEGHPAAHAKTKMQISEWTGLNDRQIRHAVKELGSIVECINSNVNRVYQPSKYRISRKLISKYRVPRDFKLSVINGGAPENRDGVGPKMSDPYPQKSQTPLQNLSYETDLNEGNYSGIPDGKQSVKTNSLNNKQDVVDENCQGWERVRRKLMNEFPDDSRRLSAAYAHINTYGLHGNTKVTNPIGFIAKTWAVIRKDYAYADQNTIPETYYEEVEEPIDQEKVARAREAAMSQLKWLGPKRK